MKLIKTIGIAVISGITALAILGAGTASAEVLLESVLCKQAPSAEHCPVGEAYALPQTIHAVLKAGTKAKLRANPVNDECTESLVKMTATEYREHSIHGTINELTFGGTCTCPTQAAVHLPWLGLLTANASGGGTLTASNAGNGNPGGLVECVVLGITLHCVYEAVNPTVSFTGGNPATATANVSLTLNTSQSSSGCKLAEGTAHWEAEYEVLSPKPLWAALFLEIL